MASDIQLSVDLNPEEAKTKADELRTTIEKIFSKTDGKQTTSAFQNLQMQMRKAYLDSSQLLGQLTKLEYIKTPTPEFSELSAKAVKLRGEITQVQKDLKRLNEIPALNGPGIAAAEQQLQGLEAELAKVTEQQEKLKAEGSAYIDNTKTAEYDNLVAKLYDANNAMSLFAKRAEEANERLLTEKMKAYESAILKVASAIGTLAKEIFGTLKTAAKTTATVIKDLTVTITKIASSATVSGVKKLSTALFGVGKSANSSNINLKKAMRTLIKYTFGVRSFFFLYRRIRKAVTEGFAEMGQYSGDLNNKISQVSTSLLYLRNALVTAFAPIVSYVAPAISQLLDLLSRAATAVGQFFAALFGATSFVRAKKVYKDYAQDLQKSQAQAEAKDEAARKKHEDSEAKRYEKYLKQKEKKEKAWQEKQLKLKKKYEKQLAGFDDVEILKKAEKEEKEEMDPFESNPYTSSASSAANQKLPWEDFNNMFETVKIEAKFKKLADKIKGFFKNEDWEGLGKFMANGINKAVSAIDKAITSPNTYKKLDKFSKAVTTTFNSLVKNVKWKNIGKTIGDGVNLILHSLNNLLTGVKWQQLGRSIADGLNGLVSTVHWDELGLFFANKLNAMINFAVGAITRFKWGDFATKLGTAINSMLLGIHWDDLAQTFSTLINRVVVALYNLGTTIKWSEIITSLTNALKLAFEGIHWQDIGMVLILGIHGVLDSIWQILNSFNWGDIGRKVGDGLNFMIQNIPWTKIGQLFAKFLNSIFDFLYNLGKTIDWKKAGDGLSKAINGFFKEFDGKKFADTLDTWVQGIYDMIKSAIKGLDKEQIKKTIKDFIGNIDFDTIKILLGALALFKGPGFVLTIAGGFLSLIVKKFAEKLAAKMVGLGSEKVLQDAIGKGVGEAGAAGMEGAHLGEATAAGGGGILSTLAGIIGLIGGAGLAVSSFVDQWKNGWSVISEILKWIGLAIGAVGAIILGVPAAIAAAVAAVIGVVMAAIIFIKEHWDEIWSYLKDHFAKMGKFFSTLWDDVKDKWGKIIDFVKDLAGKVAEKVGEIAQGAKDKIGGFFSWAQSKISAIPGKIASFFGNIWNKITEFVSNTWDKITGFLSNIWNKVTEFFGNVGGKIKDFFGNAWDKIKDFFGNAWSKTKDFFSNTWNKTKEFFSNTWSKLTESFGNIRNKISDFFGNIWNKVKDFFGNIFERVKKFFKDVWDKLVDFVTSVPKKIAGFFGDIGKKFADVGKDIIKGIWDGISSGWDWLKNKVGDVAESLLDKAKRALGIASPSKSFRDQVGKMLPAGIAVGVDANAGQALSAIDNLTNDLTNAATKAIALPPIVGGKVIPYSVGKSTSDETNDTLTKVLDMLQYNQNTGITMADLTATLETLLRRYLNIRVQLGDVEVARSANRGNELLDRRFNPSIG